MNKPTEQGYEQTRGGGVVKYQRLEIEKIEFGDVDFVISSSQGGVHSSCDYYFFDNELGKVIFTSGTCVSVRKESDGTFYCDWFDYYIVGDANYEPKKGTGYGYCSLF